MKAKLRKIKKYAKPTIKERNLIKGKINSIFSRSELRKQVLESAVIYGHHDPERPRVKKWVRCNICKKPEAASYIDIDHIDPKIPINRSFEEMSLDEYVERTWCEVVNLQPLCSTCHDIKSKEENKLRRQLKKEKKK